MSMYGAYEACNTDCLCHDCINRRRLIRGCIADCHDCDGIPEEEVPPRDPEDPWDYTIGYRSKKIGCEFYEKKCEINE